MKKRYLMLCGLLLTVAVGGCGKSNSKAADEKAAAGTVQAAAASTEKEETIEDTENIPEASRDIFAMDTYMTVTAYGAEAEEAVDQAEAEIQRLDALLSTGNPESEVGKINAAGSGVLSEDTGYLMERSMELYQDTGVFDVAIYPIMDLWGFPTENYRVPTDKELEETLELTHPEDIIYKKESGEILLGKEGMAIDFGGIAKGYTSSRIVDIYRACGIKSGMINLGGNVQVLGTKTDGSAWRVAIQSPDAGSDFLGVLSVTDRAVITSGGYERYFEKDGTAYHHIIDPKTGKPAHRGLTSVTIVSADGTLADGLSTSLFVLGEEDAISFWRAHKDQFDMILLTEDNRLLVSEGIADTFTSEQEVTVIREHA